MNRKDEDIAYGEWKQQQIDDDVYRLKQRTIGSALPDHSKVQKYANHDPNPHIPFSEAEFPTMQRWEKIAWAVLVGFFITLGILMLEAKAQTIVCSPGPNGTVICKPYPQCMPGTVC